MNKHGGGVFIEESKHIRGRGIDRSLNVIRLHETTTGHWHAARFFVVKTDPDAALRSGFRPYGRPGVWFLSADLILD